VAHSLSAKKRVRQALKHRARNRFRKDTIKDKTKGFLTALASGDLTKAETALRSAVRIMDRVAQKGTIHKNAAARKRSRLALKLNAARAAGASGKGKGKAAATA
jgi:small subunit ribosomal protein S20